MKIYIDFLTPQGGERVTRVEYADIKSVVRFHDKPGIIVVILGNDDRVTYSLDNIKFFTVKDESS